MLQKIVIRGSLNYKIKKKRLKLRCSLSTSDIWRKKNCNNRLQRIKVRFSKLQLTRVRKIEIFKIKFSKKVMGWKERRRFRLNIKNPFNKEMFRKILIIIQAELVRYSFSLNFRFKVKSILCHKQNNKKNLNSRLKKKHLKPN